MRVSFRAVKTWSFLTLVSVLALAVIMVCGYYRHSRIKALAEDLKSSKPEDAQAAAASLGEMGSDVVGYLTPMIKDMSPQSRGYVAEALRGCVGSAVPSLVAALGGEDVGMRAASAEVLGMIGPDAKDSVPALAAVLKGEDEDAEVRKKVKYALGDIRHESAIEPLIETFERDDLSDNTAAVALGKIGPAAIPFLVEKLSDKRDETKQFAAHALGKIGPAAAGGKAVESLINLLNGKESDEVRAAVVRALGEIKDVRAFKKLTDLLRERKSPEDSVIEALGEVGRAAGEGLDIEDAVGLLKQRTWEGDKNLHSYAIMARRKLTPGLVKEIDSDERDYAKAENAISEVRLLFPAKGETVDGEDGEHKWIPMTFTWELLDRKSEFTLCSVLHIDKGGNPSDGYDDYEVPAGQSLKKVVNLRYDAYQNDARFYSQVVVTACRDARTGCRRCEGREFRSSVVEYP
ncbi:MAG TPA: HEAT repeat domain-containing protein [Pyrinomonadaceae bacterium]|nr:HEAT repeat domain-containing protein [Pyrinomonadaceae bacterium]